MNWLEKQLMLIYIDSINLFIGDDSETKSQLPIMDAGCTRGYVYVYGLYEL